MSFAQDERTALATALEDAGPAAPTLCEGWRTLDLAAHLVLRENHLTAAAGLVVSPLAGHTGRVQRTLMERTPYSQLVATFRDGPPRRSMFRMPGVEERINLVEFFVHHEDIRRAADGWQPRELPPGLTALLWQRLRAARLRLRTAPVGVELVRDDLAGNPGPHQVRITAKARAPLVTVTGPPAELILWTMGRTGAARVRMDGSEADVRKLTSPGWRR